MAPSAPPRQKPGAPLVRPSSSGALQGRAPPPRRGPQKAWAWTVDGGGGAPWPSEGQGWACARPVSRPGGVRDISRLRRNAEAWRGGGPAGEAAEAKGAAPARQAPGARSPSPAGGEQPSEGRRSLAAAVGMPRSQLEPAPLLLLAAKGETRPWTGVSSLPRVSSTPLLACDRGQHQSAPHSPASSSPHATARPASQSLLRRASRRSEAGGSPAGPLFPRQEPPDEKLSGGRPVRAAARSPQPSADPDPHVQAMKEICRLRREMMIPLESMQAAMRLFREHATVPAEGVLFTDGALTKANLASIMRKLAGSDNADIESRWVDSAFKLADKDRDGSISFEEFALWFSSRSFDEDLNLDGQELELRKLSRELDLPSSVVEKYKSHFDAFDTDGSGTMCRDEFYEMMLKCLKIPRHIGLPAARLQQLWCAADADDDGEISFTEFVAFFSKYFPQGGASGMDQYYCHNRPLNVLHGTYRA
ncbi:unnamed protein product [Prorocentrum cordatum]|uniref:EF-hand domain-containing protein n=1 Tax=Prorocentrum cordatum TaxID=2364126 RepID=A0ABN9U795_9DINO|nr:unnamed protein product [Polarella glacialis]